MDLATKLQVIDLRSTFLTGRANLLRPRGVLPIPSNTFVKTTAGTIFNNSRRKSLSISSKLPVVNGETAEMEGFEYSSRFRLENVSKSYKGVMVLKDVSLEVKKGEKVGLVGENGVGKMTQLKIISDLEEPEFMSAYKEEMEVAGRLEKVQKTIEKSVDEDP
ncbi:hypothetical protein HAX54_050016 [Datura stramonium]|uniref:ABC transporter domain-containing protein n=1 Tax=Datura stramonium TaxID=4076 RepID=A0ABS8SVS0_DATST|nr:hypothetical protein [Datura stramonium]